MFGINPWVILAIVLAFIANGVYWNHHGHQAEALSWKALEAERDRLAQQKLDETRAVVKGQENQIAALKQKLEDEYVASQKRIDGLRLANGRLLDATCGVYDKNGRPVAEGGGDGLPAASGPAHTAQGRPSICDLPNAVRIAIQRFGSGVADLLYDADKAALKAGVGHDYAIEVGKILNKGVHP